MSKDTFIYGLIDGDSLELRYIGKTVRSLKQRHNEHRCKSKIDNLHLRRWVDKTNTNIIVLERSPENINDREIYWISTMKNLGANLINITSGGEINAMQGRNHTKESREKMSVSRLGKRFSDEHKQKISLALKGNIFTEEHKNNIRAKRALQVFSDEAKEKMRENAIKRNRNLRGQFIGQ